MNNETDPRTEYIKRLQDAWKGAPPEDDNSHEDGDDDPRACHARRLTSDGVPNFGDVRMNDSRVVRLHDSASTPPPSCIGMALQQIREERRRMFQGGAA